MSSDSGTSWAKREDAKEARPRVLFPERMVVFACNGVRSQFYPERKWHDGFNIPNDAFFLARPEDFRPENHGALKAKLAAKLAETRDLPFSKIEAGNIKFKFRNDVCATVLHDHTLPMIRHFATLSKPIKDEWLTAERVKKVTEHSIATFEFNQQVYRHFDGDSERLYRHLKKLFAAHGKQEEFLRIEKTMARSALSRNFQPLQMDTAEKDKLLDSMVKVEDGKVSVDTKPLSALRKRWIDENYKDLDKAIAQGSDMMRDLSAGAGAKQPFEYTDWEKKRIEDVHNITYADSPGKALKLAGYKNPELTIVLGKPQGSTGVSYSGQNLIIAGSSPPESPEHHTVSEELMHQGIDKIYNNQSLPYHDEKDLRKALFEKALAADLAHYPDSLQAIGYAPMANYVLSNTASIHMEIPVKLALALEEGGARDWSRPGESRHYHHLKEMLAKVWTPDAEDYLKGRALPDVGEDFSRTPSARNAANMPRRGWKVE